MRTNGNDDLGDGEREEAWPDQWFEEEHAPWLDKWAPKCPIGQPQRVGRLLAYREREPGRLQLRVAVQPASDNVCDVIVEETEETVQVRVLLCFEDRDATQDDGAGKYLDCPVHLYLDQPLGDRRVIDVDSQKTLALYDDRWEIEHNRRVELEQRDALSRDSASEEGSEPPATMDR